MFNTFKRGTAVLVATLALAVSTPVLAQSYYDNYNNTTQRDTRAADQFTGFVVGAIIGAALANNNDRLPRHQHNNYYYQGYGMPGHSYRYSPPRVEYRPHRDHRHREYRPHRDRYDRYDRRY